MKQEKPEDIRRFDEIEAHDGVDPDSVLDVDLAGDLRVVQLLKMVAQNHQHQAGPLFTRQVLKRTRRRDHGWWPIIACAAAVVLAVFFASHAIWKTPSGEALALQDDEIYIDPNLLREAIANDARENVVDYLQGTEQLLISLREPELTCSSDKIDLQPEKRLARSLLLQQRMFTDEIQGFEYMQTRDLLRQLELILVDLNTLDGCTDRAEIESIYQHVRDRHILTKLRLMAQEIQVS